MKTKGNKKWAWIVIIVCSIFAIGSAINNADDSETTSTSTNYSSSYDSTDYTTSSTSDYSTADISDSTTSDTSTDSSISSVSLGQQNALDDAISYINYTAFSYTGLIEQLEYEGYSNEDATYGADNCGADWSEQAAIKAQSYLDYSSFSRSELKEQLEYEGYTSEQAEYGVTAVGY